MTHTGPGMGTRRELGVLLGGTTDAKRFTVVSVSHHEFKVGDTVELSGIVGMEFKPSLWQRFKIWIGA